MQLRLHEIALPMRHAFTIALGTTTVQRNLLLELEQDGVTGYGEAAPGLAYGEFTVASMMQALESARPLIESATLTLPRRTVGPPAARRSATTDLPCARSTSPPTTFGANSRRSRSGSCGASTCRTSP